VGDPSIKAASDAPFSDPSYKAGPLLMPQYVPVTKDQAGVAENTAAWEVFKQWDKPFLRSFSDSDLITAGGEVQFQNSIPGAKGQAHSKISGAGHFLQENKGEEWAGLIVKFIQANPI
jgi:haloalkane dehalogenase